MPVGGTLQRDNVNLIEKRIKRRKKSLPVFHKNKLQRNALFAIDHLPFAHPAQPSLSKLRY
jgi:hypothetical protein